MPFTPYHFSPAAALAIPLKRYIDIPAFLLANVLIDLEPLMVLTFNLKYRLHGYFHTFLFGSLIAVLWGISVYLLRRFFHSLMSALRVDYLSNLRKAIFSSIAGVWFHILLDSTLYSDIRPFFPYKSNPLLGLVSFPDMYLYCEILFIPAILLYGFEAYRFTKRDTISVK